MDKNVLYQLGVCFLKCINYFTNKDFTGEFREFVKNEKYRS